jgi:fumarate reductase subunit C
MNRGRIVDPIERYAKAIGVALSFVVLLFGLVALMSWARGLKPFWLQLLVSSVAILIAVVILKLFFLKAPKSF